MAVSQADLIRAHARKRFVEVARRADQKTVTIVAGEVGRDLGMSNRMPNVCQALRSRKFCDMARVELLEHTGPEAGASTRFVYAIKPSVEDSLYRSEVAPPARQPAGVSADYGRPTTRVGPAARRLTAPADRSPALPTTALCLVSCVAGKLPHPAPAKELYTSAWFQKAREFVEARGWPWFILSAKYGLVAPEAVIAPYEKTLNTMGASERRDWAGRCLQALRPHLAGVKCVVFLAGMKYREYLASELPGLGVDVHVPMEGLPIGKQLAWLDRHAP